MPMNLPPWIEQQVDEWESRQTYNPLETEKVEGSLRLTKNRRMIQIGHHYYSHHQPSHQD